MSAQQVLANLGEPEVSSRTIQRRLVEAGLKARRPAKKPLLSKKNRDARLLFATFHRQWTAREWKKVLFSYESKFCIFRSDDARWVGRVVQKAKGYTQNT